MHLQHDHQITLSDPQFLSAAKIVKKVTPQAELQCPLCQCMLNKPDFINHVGEHMEVIALHAMPNSISDLESDLELTILNNNISAEAFATGNFSIDSRF